MGPRSYSKSDDEQSNASSNLNAENETKSDPDSTNANATTPAIDYRALFRQNIHKAAQRNKEKEIELVVENFKHEMRQNHYNNRNKFGPYDDEQDSNFYSGTNKSPSMAKQSTDSPTKSPSKSPTNSRSKSPSKSRSKSPSVSHSNSASQSLINTPPSNNSTSGSKEDQIMNVLKTLNLPKLQNGLAHVLHHPIVHAVEDMDLSNNYGKHLKLILNSCKIHNRSEKTEQEKEEEKYFCVT